MKQKESKKEKYRYEESTCPPMKRQLGVRAQSHFMCALVPYMSDDFGFLLIAQTTTVFSLMVSCLEFISV